MPININITDGEKATPQEPEGVKIEDVEKDKSITISWADGAVAAE